MCCRVCARDFKGMNIYIRKDIVQCGHGRLFPSAGRRSGKRENPVKALIRPANNFKPILCIVVPLERLAALVDSGKKGKK
jgi:hypothetical protein